MKDNKQKPEEKLTGGMDKPVKVNYAERVTVYSTDKDKHNKTGTEMKVAPLQAKDLIRRGLVSETKPEPKDDAFESKGGADGKGKDKDKDEEL